MIYELLIENQLADINEKISVQITKAIDDINDFGSRNTGFSKSIVLPATGRNNQLFGHYNEISQANTHSVTLPNIGANFNVAKVCRAELRANGLLVLKGFFRITKMVKTGKFFEYEGNLFGELGTFVSELGSDKLEDLDFSAYDHSYNASGITNSWNTISGSSYYYPLIDYGTYSSNKVDYDIRTLRPAFYVKEYIDKIFANAGYTYESDFFDTSFFKSLIIPHNQQRLTKLDDTQFLGGLGPVTLDPSGGAIDIDTLTLGDFTLVGLNQLQYNGASNLLCNITASIGYTYLGANTLDLVIRNNGSNLGSISFTAATGGSVSLTVNNVTIAPNDIIEAAIEVQGFNVDNIDISLGTFNVFTNTPQLLTLNPNDFIVANDTIPRGVFQRDFFVWILRMFNLYVDEDKVIDRKLIIKPYVDYYDLTNQIDWTYKLAHDKQIEITPMGQLNGKIFETKYKSDSDFYNEQYQKKYNQTYGDRQFDTGFNFAKERQSVEIGFSPSPLVQYSGTDKVVTAIYKKSKGNSVDQEELTESNIRILIAKKITGVTSWGIKDGATTLSTQTAYGYAGHVNDPVNPTKDINFGVPFEIYFSPDSYTSNNAFNEYWSAYIAEIADKDSKLIKAYFRLTPLDIAKLDFSIPVFIDGVRYRLNKVEDYDVTDELTRCELLKIIDNG